MQKTRDRIFDIVFPLVSAKREGNKFAYDSLLGTGFLIGKNGFAITAAHVMEQKIEENQIIVGLFYDNNDQFKVFPVLESESHNVEDVAILKFDVLPWSSWLIIDNNSENQSCEYDSWGYPISVAEIYSRFDQTEKDNLDLIYTSGYIRRRISRELPASIHKGKAFYELSEMAGSGCSGGPVISRPSIGSSYWKVIGVYIGEAEAGFKVSYSTRSDSISDWKPTILGRSLFDESSDL